MKYVIYADEAWTQSSPLYRYHCFFGGLLSTQKNFNELEQRIKQLKKHFNYKKEIKWSNISQKNIDFYNEILICVEEFIKEKPETKYRQLFMDRAYSYAGPMCSELEGQFKIYYQFLKHCFGFQFIQSKALVVFKLDTHSSHYHKKTLSVYIQELKFPNVEIKIEFINSKKSIALQVCDLLMGAAGYHGNKIDWDIQQNRRTRTKNQKMKSIFSKEVYYLLRRINNQYRNSSGFNWFETTGVDGNRKNHYDHKLRIWKFIPNNNIHDPSWEDDAFKGNRIRRKP